MGTVVLLSARVILCHWTTVDDVTPVVFKPSTIQDIVLSHVSCLQKVTKTSV